MKANKGRITDKPYKLKDTHTQTHTHIVLHEAFREDKTKTNQMTIYHRKI